MYCDGKCFTYPRNNLRKLCYKEYSKHHFQVIKKLSSTTVNKSNSNFNKAHGKIIINSKNYCVL